MKIFACFIKHACLLAARMRKLCGTYIPMHIAELHNSLYYFSLFESQLACLQSFPFFFGGGGFYHSMFKK
jgi:hypothetical protein